MRFSVLVQVAAALSQPAAIVLAAPSSSAEACTISWRTTPGGSTDRSIDLKCSKGYEFGHYTPIIHFGIESEKFMAAVGTFFHMKWYVSTFFAFDCVSVTHIHYQTQAETNNTGSDNTVGAIRSGTFQDAFYSERLTQYHRFDADYLSMIWTSTHPATFPSMSPTGTITFEKFTEFLEVISICGGKATEVRFPAYWCADDTNARYAYDVWYRVKMAIIQLSLDIAAPILPNGQCQGELFRFFLA